MLHGAEEAAVAGVESEVAGPYFLQTSFVAGKDARGTQGTGVYHSEWGSDGVAKS